MTEEESITVAEDRDEDELAVAELLKESQMGALDFFAELVLPTDSELYKNVEKMTEENRQQLLKTATEGGRKKGGTVKAYQQKLMRRRYVRYLERRKGQR